MAEIAFLGLGVMGFPMAGHIARLFFYIPSGPSVRVAIKRIFQNIKRTILSRLVHYKKPLLTLVFTGFSACSARVLALSLPEISTQPGASHERQPTRH